MSEDTRGRVYVEFGGKIVSYVSIIAVMESKRGPSVMVMEGMSPIRHHCCRIDKGSSQDHPSEVKGRSGVGESATGPVNEACQSHLPIPVGLFPL